MAIRETIRVRPAPAKDKFGDPISSTPPPWRDIPGATVVPRSSQDYEQRGQIVVSGFMVALPGTVKDSVGDDVVLERTDEFEIRGLIYQVDGEIGNYGRKIIFYTMRAN